MLHEAALGAAHHAQRRMRFHEHADDGFLRHGAMDASVQPLPIVGREDAVLEAGPVVRIDALDAILHVRRSAERRVQRQVGSFRVAAHEQAAGQVRSDGFQVAEGLLLSRNG